MGTAAQRLDLHHVKAHDARANASSDESVVGFACSTEMNDESEVKRKTWFVLDELASLQRLPQLTTAVTENRKSNNPMVLGFQGKAQVEALYGHVSEAMLSQPATRIFLKTSEPGASSGFQRPLERSRLNVSGSRERTESFLRTQKVNNETSRGSPSSWRLRSVAWTPCTGT